MIANEHEFAMLVNDLDVLCNSSVTGRLAFAFVRNGDLGMNGVTNKNRFYKAKSVIPTRHRLWIYFRRGEADTDTKYHGAVGYPLFERLCFTPFRVHVMREKIPGMPRMYYKICFRNGTAKRYPFALRDIVVK